MNLWHLDPLERWYENFRREVVSIVELQLPLGEGELWIQEIFHLHRGGIQGSEPHSPCHLPAASCSGGGRGAWMSLSLLCFEQGPAVTVRLQRVALVMAKPSIYIQVIFLPRKLSSTLPIAYNHPYKNTNINQAT